MIDDIGVVFAHQSSFVTKKYDFYIEKKIILFRKVE